MQEWMIVWLVWLGSYKSSVRDYRLGTYLGVSSV